MHGCTLSLGFDSIQTPAVIMYPIDTYHGRPPLLALSNNLTDFLAQIRILYPRHRGVIQLQLQASEAQLG